MVNRIITLTAAVIVAGSSLASAQTATAPRAVTESLKGWADIAKSFVTRTAEQVPEAMFGYQPTKEVRTLGQILAHVADANYLFCGLASGEKGPADSVEKTRTSRADIQKALAESYAFCDRAFAGLDDQTGAAGVVIAQANNMKTTKLGALSFNTAHNMEHYGNLVTYMRMNKIVPPSSAP